MPQPRSEFRQLPQLAQVMALVYHHRAALHAGARCAAHQRNELERLCRNITRPTIANERLSRNAKSQVVLQLKSP